MNIGSLKWKENYNLIAMYVRRMQKGVPFMNDSLQHGARTGMTRHILHEIHHIRVLGEYEIERKEHKGIRNSLIFFCIFIGQLMATDHIHHF